MHGFQKVTNFFCKKIIKNFPLITQFFDLPFGVFRREIPAFSEPARNAP